MEQMLKVDFLVELVDVEDRQKLIDALIEAIIDVVDAHGTVCGGGTRLVTVDEEGEVIDNEAG